MYSDQNICLTKKGNPTMHITPKRRRRAMRVHYLTQRSGTQKDIAAQLNISKATVRADLQLVETHWSSIASAAADDLLLESLHLLQLRLTLALKNDDVANQISRLTSVEYLRARDAQENQLNTLAREIRRTAQEVQRRAAQRPDQPELYEEDSQDLAETTPESTQIDPPNSTISSPEQEITADQPETEKIPTDPDLEALVEEAVQHFPHLKGKSPDQIVLFLDRITNPETPDSEYPAEIYAEAAG